MRHRLEITCAAVDGGAETVAPHSLGLTRKTTLRSQLMRLGTGASIRRASRRFNMGKNIEHKKATDEQGLSDQEIWWKIRYLDPDIKRSDSVVTITVLAILAIVGVVVALLYSRGL